MNCFSCGTLIEQFTGFRDSCPKCSRDTHVCLNCRFYDPQAHRQCRETDVELVVDKEKRNFCEYFKLRDQSSSVKSPTLSAREQAEALFKKKLPPK